MFHDIILKFKEMLLNTAIHKWFTYIIHFPKQVYELGIVMPSHKLEN